MKLLTPLCATTLCLSLLGTASHAQPKSQLPLGANEWTSLYATFDNNLYAGNSSGNPYSAGNEVQLADGGVAGKAAQGTGRSSDLVFAGDNMSGVTGTLRLFIKNPSNQNVFNDGKEYFIAAAERNSPVRYDNGALNKLPGFSFLLYKSTDNALIFGLTNQTYGYIRQPGTPNGLPPHPMPVSVSIPSSTLAPADWHEVILSWNLPQKKFWLRVGSVQQEGTLPDNFVAGAFDYLMLTTHPNFYTDRQGNFPGLIDELLISPHSIEEWLTAKAPKTAKREEIAAPVWTRSQPKLFTDGPWREYETQFRTSLDTQARFQNRADGWSFSYAYPSGMGFMSNKVRSPLPPTYYVNSKDGSSTLAAFRYQMAYEALGEEKYLQVAQRAAGALLKAQQADGWWPYAWTILEDGSVVFDTPETAPMEDHTQSVPILTMLYLHRLTKEEKYLQSAMRGLDFLLKAQNSNGSWSHHYNLKKQASETRSGLVGGGELNDFTTTGPMRLVLLGYRLTKETRYLTAYLKAANWLAGDAFFDKAATGGAVGWAQQYSAQNQPVWARAFEPPALQTHASAMAASELINVYRLTGEERYLAPVRKWLDWWQGQGPTHYFYYEVDTARPIAAFNRKIYFLDEEAQLAEMKAAVERTGQPLDQGTGKRDWVGLAKYAKQLESALKEKPQELEVPIPTKEQLEAELQTVTSALESWSKSFDWETASYGASRNGTPGTRIGVSNTRWVMAAWAFARARALQGQIPLTHPLLRVPQAHDLYVTTEVIAPQLNLYARFSPAEIAASQPK